MDKRLYILAELDEKTQIALNMYKEIISGNGIIDKQTEGLPYHITLSAHPIGHEDALKNLLDEVRERHRRIHTVYTGFGLFGLYVVYLNPAMNMKLMELYDFVKNGDDPEQDAFAAHTTIFIGEPADTLKLLPIFAEKAENIVGEIKYISLYEFFPARFIKRIELSDE